ncbi:MAG: D-alanyl-D-alanine carboxypeptidase/D-alanyl-D-alanine-endopeptidase [Planctomycetota bacterium]
MRASRPTCSNRVPHGTLSGLSRPAWRRALVALTVIGACVWPSGATHADVETRLRQVLGGADLRQTVAGISVRDVGSGEILAEIDAHQPMIPASNMKLLTTAAALARLGPDFVFETKLQHLPPDAEDPRHRLLVRGGGDPAFADPVLLFRLEQQLNADRPADDHISLNADVVLDRWVDAAVNHAQAQGLAGFDVLLIDDRVFDRQFIHPDWPRDQLDRDYCAQVAGLNFFNNVIDVRASPTQNGFAPRVTVYPLHPAIGTTNLARTGSRHGFWIGREPGTNTFTFRGTVRSRTSASVTVHDPSVVFAELLRHRVQQRGITVGAVERIAPNAPVLTGTPLQKFRTTLPWVLDRTNQDSANLYAEALLKRMGFELTGTPGSFANGSAAIRHFMSQLLTGRVRTAGVQIADGSGLSHRNRVSPRVLTELLIAMYQRDEFRDAYVASLAEGGESGTLRRRLDRGLSADVYAKTGFISRKVDGSHISASCISGYLIYPTSNADPSNTAPTRVVAFSIMLNNFAPKSGNRAMKQLQDQLIDAIDDVVSTQLALQATP